MISIKKIRQDAKRNEDAKRNKEIVKLLKKFGVKRYSDLEGKQKKGFDDALFPLLFDNALVNYITI